jgi:hypothetical protein
MKMLYLKIFFLLISYSFVFAGGNIVYIETNKPDSKIFIDDNFIGEGNVVVQLEPGDYYLTIRESATQWNSQIISDSLKVLGNSDAIKLKYAFKSRELINTSPQDSQVFSRDSLIGRSPLLLDRSINDITIRKENYADKTFDLKNGFPQTPIQLDFIGEEDNGRFVGSKLFWGLVSSAVAMGATAAYYKIKADKNYDKYLDTGRQDYLDKTKDQDVYSGIAFGSLQINLGIILYLLLND